ncbi:ankyrin repeat domain-containing protein [Undibacterium sp. Ji42W]|uniref:ankyrin repeat domain-containing protein n=1 Tax=Undibacterium sp. Ji42W TaxID=3413039 RepID=UPI003BF21DA6
MISNYIAGHPGKDYGYDRLMEAVYYTPHSVRQMINCEPELLNCKNYSGETVMHWFVVENDIEIVELLSSCGGMVSSYALTEACSLGYVDMVYLLLGIGIVPDMTSCRVQINLGSNMPRKTLIKLRRAFNRYGYKLDWPLAEKPAF